MSGGPLGEELSTDVACLLPQLAKAAGVNQAGLDHFYKVLRVTAQYELCALRSASLWMVVHQTNVCQPALLTVVDAALLTLVSCRFDKYASGWYAYVVFTRRTAHRMI